MNTPLNVAFIWHMHQPYYKDLLSGNYLLPWVRLHATKDYYDMAAILDRFPTINQTFNVVPSLLIQIDDYAKGEARDIFLELSKKAAHDLNDSEKEFVLLNFFFALAYPLCPFSGALRPAILMNWEPLTLLRTRKVSPSITS